MPVMKFQDLAAPIVPDNFTEITGWAKGFLVELKYFLDNCSRAISLLIDGDIEVMRLTEQTVEPVTKNDGTIVYADGSTWNPGGGEGFYGRVAGAWVKLH